MRKRRVDGPRIGWVSTRSNLHAVRPGQSVLFDVQLLIASIRDTVINYTANNVS